MVIAELSPGKYIEVFKNGWHFFHCARCDCPMLFLSIESIKSTDLLEKTTRLETSCNCWKSLEVPVGFLAVLAETIAMLRSNHTIDSENVHFLEALGEELDYTVTESKNPTFVKNNIFTKSKSI